MGEDVFQVCLNFLFDFVVVIVLLLVGGFIIQKQKPRGVCMRGEISQKTGSRSPQKPSAR